MAYGYAVANGRLQSPGWATSLCPRCKAELDHPVGEDARCLRPGCNVRRQSARRLVRVR